LLIKFNFFFCNIAFIIIFFIKLIFINFSTADLFTKLNLNENIVNLFFIFWTNYWFLFIFFMFINIINWIHFYNYYSNIYIYLIVFFFLPYTGEIFDFYLSSYLLSFLNINLFNINFLLLNNLNKYHPFILYTSAAYILFLLYFFLFFQISNFNYFKNFFCFKTQINLVWCNLNLIVSALYLGSWWALQESSWGGWWNWDASETLGLLIFFFIIRIIHSTNVINFYIFFQYLSSILIFLIILAYFFIQLNFEFTSHNFGIKFFFFFSNNTFLIESIRFNLFIIFFLITKLFTLIHRNLFFFKYQDIFNLKILYKNYIIILISILILKSLIVSFSFLWNFFSWNFLYLNISNSEVELKLEYVMLLFFLFSVTVKFNILFLINILNYFIFNFYFMIALIKNKPIIVIFLHLLIINFLNFNFLNSNIDLFKFDYYLIFENFIFNHIFYFCNANIILDVFFVEINHKFLFRYDWFDNITIFNSLTLNNLPFFLFHFTNNNFWHIIITAINFFFLESCFLSNCIFFFILISFSIWLILRKKIFLNQIWL
jgi:hypothetical protein